MVFFTLVRSKIISIPLRTVTNTLYSAQAQASDEALLVEDVKTELEDILAALSGKGSKRPVNTSSKVRRGAKTGAGLKGGTFGRTGVKKGQKLRGDERKKAWQTVKDLGKEYVAGILSFGCRCNMAIALRYRNREGGVVKSVLSKAQVPSLPVEHVPLTLNFSSNLRRLCSRLVMGLALGSYTVQNSTS